VPTSTVNAPAFTHAQDYVTRWGNVHEIQEFESDVAYDGEEPSEFDVAHGGEEPSGGTAAGAGEPVVEDEATTASDGMNDSDFLASFDAQRAKRG
jgi:hypothetical protein